MNNKKTSYKLLSLDLDGTLLSRVLHKAKKQDCKAIQEFMDCGGMLMINTGRAPWAVTKTIAQINKFGKNKIQLISCWNGAYIRDFKDNTIYETCISHQYCSKILNIVKESKKVSIWFYTKRGRVKKQVEAWPNNLLIKTVYTRSNIVKIKDENDLSSNKIVIFSSNQKAVDSIYRELIKQKINKIVTIIHTSPRMIEITPSGCSKGYAIDKIANKYKIPKNEIVSMGDSFNDLCAFKHSALSIAINPKNPKLLTYVNEIVREKNYPIKKAIHEYVLRKKK